MKKIIPISVFVVMTICLSLISCKKEASDPDYCGTAWSTKLSSELTALSNASMAYSNNPTTVTCSSYQTAYQNYLNALKPFTKCTLYTPAQKTELENSIAQAETEISTLCD